MCEVTLQNFNDIFPELQSVLNSAKFVSIDTEFSCLIASNKLQNSLFDTPQERYSKLRKTVEHIIPVQFGLTAYTFDPNCNEYKGNLYTFYIFPRPFAYLDMTFLCQASSLLFLSAHKFDFNKLVYQGIPYLNRLQEESIRNEIKNIHMANSSSDLVLEDLLEYYTAEIQNWISCAKENDYILLKKQELLMNHFEIRYFLHKELRNRHKCLWTFEDAEGFKVRKVSLELCTDLIKNNKLDEELLDNLLGFTKVFKLLASLKKPIIGHNLFFDLMLLTHHFENPLPKSYSAFKKTVNSLFPTIYDTKYITFDFSRSILKNNKFNKTSLENVYHYFKDAEGRHLAPNSPLIQPQDNSICTFHNAGWDSYCSGYVFIRIAHVCAASKTQAKRKIFMSNQLLQAVSEFKNRINIARGDVSFIQLDGKDPESRRPPRLIVQGLNKQSLDIAEVTALFSNYGYVEVKPYSSKGQRAIVAVDNFGSIRRILSQFQSHADFKVQPYNFLRHSPVANALLWSGLILSGSFLVCYGYLKAR